RRGQGRQHGRRRPVDHALLDLHHPVVLLGLLHRGILQALGRPLARCRPPPAPPLPPRLVLVPVPRRSAEPVFDPGRRSSSSTSTVTVCHFCRKIQLEGELQVSGGRWRNEPCPCWNNRKPKSCWPMPS